MSTPTIRSIPALLSISATGGIEGRTSRYEVRKERLAGVYADSSAFATLVSSSEGAEELVYWVDAHMYDEGPGALTIGTSTLLPGTVGDEFAVTRGHLHALADRAELYYCLSGHGLMLMETLDGQTSVVELTPGGAAHVPGGWIHRSVNVGTEPFVTLFCYNSDAGQNYEVIANAGGMSQRVVTAPDGGWQLTPNTGHMGYATPMPEVG
jgi:glucose-6-phosphate isomerase